MVRDKRPEWSHLLVIIIRIPTNKIEKSVAPHYMYRLQSFTGCTYNKYISLSSLSLSLSLNAYTCVCFFNLPISLLNLYLPLPHLQIVFYGYNNNNNKIESAVRPIGTNRFLLLTGEFIIFVLFCENLFPIDRFFMFRFIRDRVTYLYMAHIDVNNVNDDIRMSR